MRLHYIQHVPFEDLGYIETWAKNRSAEISCTRLFSGESLPDTGQFDWLVVMGGPMGVHDLTEYPWLAEEKSFIHQSITNGKTVMGICLGAQLIADTLGARVYRGEKKEIGWFHIQRAVDAPELIPEELTVFHWHGDTFELPDGAIHLASSEACGNQGFVYDDRVVALQFHMETTEKGMNALIKNCGDELKETSRYIQTIEQMQNGISNIIPVNTAMEQLLDSLAIRQLP